MNATPPLSPFQHLRHDAPAGLVVFLVALPLCLGIAFASNAPLVSGLVAGIVGGLVVAVLSKAPLAVSGPAAGLTVIVVDAIAELGSYELFLTAVLLAGVFQVALGFARAGKIAHFFPASVIKGMLAGIGAVLILKQIPHAFGFDGDYEGDFTFAQADGRNTLTEIPYALGHYHRGATLIGMVSLSILIFWPKISARIRATAIPAPLLVVGFGIAMNYLFEAVVTSLSVREHLLVGVPITDGLGPLVASLPRPDLTAFDNLAVWKTGAVIAVVASIETLLCVEAVDKIDQLRRVTPANRELKAQGVGNMVCGLFGGLPLTAVIVRGSANVYSGAKTQASAFIHALLLVGTVVAIPGLLNQIPLAALAAILLHVGYKLMPLSLFREMYAEGWERMLPFSITIAGILFTDLLIGVGLGLCASVVFVLKAHVSHAVRLRHGDTDDSFVMRLGETVSFLHKPKIREIFENLPDGASLSITGEQVRYLDEEIAELIREYKITALQRGISLDTSGVRLRDPNLSGPHPSLERGAGSRRGEADRDATASQPRPPLPVSLDRGQWASRCGDEPDPDATPSPENKSPEPRRDIG